jgi:hypothetical protein
MQLLVRIITDDLLSNLRALLIEIQRLVSAAIDAGFTLLATLLGT